MATLDASRSGVLACIGGGYQVSSEKKETRLVFAIHRASLVFNLPACKKDKRNEVLKANVQVI